MSPDIPLWPYGGDSLHELHEAVQPRVCFRLSGPDCEIRGLLSVPLFYTLPRMSFGSKYG